MGKGIRVGRFCLFVFKREGYFSTCKETLITLQPLTVWTKRKIKHFLWSRSKCAAAPMLSSVCCIAPCMSLHIQLCYRSVVSRVETSKILKNCISNSASVHFISVQSAEVLHYELFLELLCLAVPLLGPLLDAVRWLQRVRPFQGPSIQSRLEGSVVEDAAGQQDGGTPLGGILCRHGWWWSTGSTRYFNSFLFFFLK